MPLRARSSFSVSPNRSSGSTNSEKAGPEPLPPPPYSFTNPLRLPLNELFYPQLVTCGPHLFVLTNGSLLARINPSTGTRKLLAQVEDGSFGSSFASSGPSGDASLFCIGGRKRTDAKTSSTKFEYITRVHSYSVEHNLWDSGVAAPIPEPRVVAAVASLPALQLLFVSGGSTSFKSGIFIQTRPHRVLRYDIARNAWNSKAIASLQPFRTDHAMVAFQLPAGAQKSDAFHLLVCGGRMRDGRSENSCDIYDSTTNTWRATKPMRYRREGHSLVFSEGKIYAFGCANVPGIPIECFDPVTETWTTHASAPPGRISAASFSS